MSTFRLDCLQVDQLGNLVIIANIPSQEPATKKVKGQCSEKAKSKSSENLLTATKSAEQASSILENLLTATTLETQQVAEESVHERDNDDFENNVKNAASIAEMNFSTSEEEGVTFELEVTDGNNRIVQVREVLAEGDADQKASEEDSGTAAEVNDDESWTQNEQVRVKHFNKLASLNKTQDSYVLFIRSGSYTNIQMPCVKLYSTECDKPR